jgi:hypothetical protein
MVPTANDGRNDIATGFWGISVSPRGRGYVERADGRYGSNQLWRAASSGANGHLITLLPAPGRADFTKVIISTSHP